MTEPLRMASNKKDLATQYDKHNLKIHFVKYINVSDYNI